MAGAGVVLPPFSEEAEEAVLGSALVDPDGCRRWVDVLNPDDFYVHSNRFAWEAVQTLTRAGRYADLMTVGEWLRAKPGTTNGRDPEGPANLLAECGGEGWLARLTLVPVNVLNGDTYAEMVRDLAERRGIINAAQEMVKAAYGQDLPMDEVRAKVATAVAGAARSGGRGGPKKQADVVEALAGKISARMAGELVEEGFSTGLIDLDRVLLGLYRGEMSVWAGRPGMGKSALLKTIVDSVSRGIVGGAKRAKPRRVLVFSLEMLDEIWVGRAWASLASVDSAKVVRRAQPVTDEEWNRLATTMVELSDAPVWIDHTRGLSVMDIRARARMLAAKIGGIDLIVVDHLTLVTAGRKFDRYDREVGWVSLQMRELAQELNAHVCLVAQLNRKVEERADKRPMLSDLREAGQIEEHTDDVVSLYRDEYYNSDTTTKGVMELGVLKNRNMATGTVHVGYDATRQSVYNIVRERLAL